MKKNGFTIIELLVVVSIIGILLTLVIPMGGQAKQKARIAKAKSEIAALETAISSYYADMGAYPTNRTSTDKCEDRNTTIITYLSGRTGGTGAYDTTITTQSQWNGPYMEFDTPAIEGGQFIDPWKQPYHMAIDLDGNVTTTPPTHNALTFDLASDGPDKTAGTGDDVTNY